MTEIIKIIKCKIVLKLYVSITATNLHQGDSDVVIMLLVRDLAFHATVVVLQHANCVLIAVNLCLETHTTQLVHHDFEWQSDLNHNA